MTERRCDGCRWFWRYIREDIGQCRRYPPTQSIETGWIEASPFDWCGEWSDKNITPEEAERRELVRQFAVALVASGSQDMIHKIWQQAALFADYEGQQ